MRSRHYEELEAETRRVLAEKRWSYRQAERQTGIGFTTVSNMANGKRPGFETIVAWARAVGEDELVWLAAAGYDIRLDTEALPAEVRVPLPEEQDELIKELRFLTGRLREQDKNLILDFARMLADKHKDKDPRDQDYR